MIVYVERDLHIRVPKGYKLRVDPGAPALLERLVGALGLIMRTDNPICGQSI
jgi:hypothetical protein